MGLIVASLSRAELLAQMRRQRDEMTAAILTLEREEAGRGGAAKFSMVG